MDNVSTPSQWLVGGATDASTRVAENVVADLQGNSAVSQYNRYGSCPLKAKKGKIVLAEFGYGGKLLPSFPAFLIDRIKPSRAAWFLKEIRLPRIYLRGHEWMAKPEKTVAS